MSAGDAQLMRLSAQTRPEFRIPWALHGAMLAAMADAEALEAVRSAIRALFPVGQARERWLAWAERIQDEECRDTGWTTRSRRRQNSPHAARPLRDRT